MNQETKERKEGKEFILNHLRETIGTHRKAGSTVYKINYGWDEETGKVTMSTEAVTEINNN